MKTFNTFLVETKQEISSADTSQKIVAALFKKVEWKEGTTNIDIGGGKYDLATEFLESKGVENYVYDQYNRSEKHNSMVLSKAPFDTSTVNNVLNVIQEDDAQEEVLRLAKKLTKDGGKIYVSVYIGDESGEGKKTTKGFQHNKKLKEYFPLLKKVLGSFSRVKGTTNAIVALKD
jgi:hypothetical protein